MYACGVSLRERKKEIPLCITLCPAPDFPQQIKLCFAIHFIATRFFTSCLILNNMMKRNFVWAFSVWRLRLNPSTKRWWLIFYYPLKNKKNLTMKCMHFWKISAHLSLSTKRKQNPYGRREKKRRLVEPVYMTLKADIWNPLLTLFQEPNNNQTTVLLAVQVRRVTSLNIFTFIALGRHFYSEQLTFTLFIKPSSWGLRALLK